jgi:hypothetical protein
MAVAVCHINNALDNLNVDLFCTTDGFTRACWKTACTTPSTAHAAAATAAVSAAAAAMA